MRTPRFRFTTVRVMSLALLAGLATWGFFALGIQRAPTIVENQDDPKDKRELLAREDAPTIAENQAEASYKQALLTREVAEYALKEYVEGIYGRDKAKAEAEIALTRSAPESAIDRAFRSNMPIIRPRGPMDPARLDLLAKYTKEKTIKELTSEIQKARADEQAKLETLRIERAKR